LSIDDATGVIPAAVFRGQEDAAGYFTVLAGTARRVGLPTALYTDRHGSFTKDPDRPPGAHSPRSAVGGSQLTAPSESDGIPQRAWSGQSPTLTSRGATLEGSGTGGLLGVGVGQGPGVMPGPEDKK
jgi:hypothetical protein